MNVLLLTSHSIAEHDDLDMFTRMGVDTFSIGAYTDPAHPGDDKRPPLPDAPYHADLAVAVERHRAEMTERMGEPGPRIDWAKAVLPDDVLDWADTIIVHHFPEWWIGGQWGRIRSKRVIWRTCGQSNPDLERFMARFRADGLQIVRYSPREHSGFGQDFAGQDALIRFGKDPAEWRGWTGGIKAVGNITQNMHERGDACGLSYYLRATEGLHTMPAGPGSEHLRGGVGTLDYERMRQYLRDIRVYLYTGTRPASYTLGLIEAMMTGVPVVSIGPTAFGVPELFETLVPLTFDDPAKAMGELAFYLADDAAAKAMSEASRQIAVEAFGLDGVMARWGAFLGVPAMAVAA